MIASMFNLDHRLAELRPTEAELRVARERRDAAATAARRPMGSGGPAEARGAASLPARPTRIAVG